MYTPADKIQQRERRRARVRAKISGSSARPRLSVFRSSKHIYAQLIDDEKNSTLLSVSDSQLTDKSDKGETSEAMPRVGTAYALGKFLAKLAQEKKISQIVFDRAGYKYHGRVKALADGARDGGLVF